MKEEVVGELGMYDWVFTKKGFTSVSLVYSLLSCLFIDNV